MPGERGRRDAAAAPSPHVGRHAAAAPSPHVGRDAAAAPSPHVGRHAAAAPPARAAGRGDEAAAPNPLSAGRGDEAAAPNPRAAAAAAAATPAVPQPVALFYGPGHRIVHANPAFVAEFGDHGRLPIGVPAAEALLDMPPVVLEVVDRVLATGRPLAAWVDVRGRRRRLTVAPRTDVDTGEVYGVALRLASE